MMRLYFVRHGQTDYNLKKIVQGGGIDSDLNANGRAQAQAFFESYRHYHFDAVFASPLKRTHQTLAPWLNQGYSYHVEPGLQEFNWGIHEGRKPTPEDRADFMEVLKRWGEGDHHATVEQGESLFQAWKRAESFFRELPQKHAGEQLLLCSHGRQLRILLCNILGVGFSEMDRFNHDNTGLTIVEWHPDGTTELILLNNTTHLSKRKV